MKYMLILGLLASCASTPPEEREWRRGIDRENWELCQYAYHQTGHIFYHIDHLWGRESYFYIKQDLAINNCEMILGEYWANY